MCLCADEPVVKEYNFPITPQHRPASNDGEMQRLYK